MKFILMTNPTLNNNVLEELLKSGLKPEALVTSMPFFVRKTNFIKLFLKKIMFLSAYLLNKDKVEIKFQPYFLAKKNNIPIYNSHYVNSEKFAQQIRDMDIDYVFTFGFKILKENIINAPKKGCINFHPAYLPFNRGATPSKWVIANNQTETGITFHYINKGIDKGDIIEQYRVPISGYETSEILDNNLFSLGAVLLVKLIYKIKNNVTIDRLPNVIENGSYEPPFKKENRIVSERNTLAEIKKTVSASVDGYNGASYNFNNKKFRIINCVEIPEMNTRNVFPFLTPNKNMVIKTSDNKQLLLITKKDINE